MESLRITRERNALQAGLKELKRTQIQELCRTHKITNTQRTKVTLESELVEHFLTEHTGRVLQIAKCDKSGSLLGSSTATRALVPQKRTTEQSSAGPAKRVASSSNPHASTSQDSSQAVTITELKSTVNELLTQVAALSEPKPAGLTEEQVIALIDARLAQQRQEFQQSLQELQELCETGFVNTQASFDAVGEWKEEVQQSFTRIQDWASDIEKKLIATQTDQPQREPSTSQSTRLSHLSSTPSASAVSNWQTPAGPVISNGSGMRRLSRLSDGIDFSLATIPEGPNTPTLSEDQRQVTNVDSPVRPLAQNNIPATDKKHVTISLATEDIPPVAEGPTEDSAILSEDEGISESGRPDNTQPLIAFTPKQITRTPAASRTLFGTEKSTEARFDDILEVMDQSITTESTLPQAWTSISPSRLFQTADV